LSTASALPHARMSVVYGVTEAWPTSCVMPHAIICSSTCRPRSISCACLGLGLGLANPNQVDLLRLFRVSVRVRVS